MFTIPPRRFSLLPPHVTETPCSTGDRDFGGDLEKTDRRTRVSHGGFEINLFGRNKSARHLGQVTGRRAATYARARRRDPRRERDGDRASGAGVGRTRAQCDSASIGRTGALGGAVSCHLGLCIVCSAVIVCTGEVYTRCDAVSRCLSSCQTVVRNGTAGREGFPIQPGLQHECVKW